MKRLLIILAIVLIGMTANAQKGLRQFADDTIKADINTYVLNKKVDQYANQVVIFTFTKADVADSLSAAKIQGSNDNVTFYDLAASSANLTTTTTDGTTRLYVTNPLDLYYRGYLSCATGDTVAVTNPDMMLKEDE